MMTQNAPFSSANQAPIRAYIAGATWRHERNGHIAILRKGTIIFNVLFLKTKINNNHISFCLPDGPP
jgi:hypothetical protein